MASGGFVMTLRLFFRAARLSYVALFRWLRPTQYIASKLAMPLAQMLFFVFVGTFGAAGVGQDFFVIGNALQIAAVSGIYGVTMSIGGDRWEGTLVYLFGTPANRPAIFFGRALVHIFDGFLGVAVALMWGVVLFGLSFANLSVALLALIVLITVYSTCGLGLLMGCIGLITRNVMFVNNTVYFVLLLLSGANVPEAMMPGWLWAIGRAVPLSHGIQAARRAFAGAPDAEVWNLVAREAAVGTAYLLVGYFLFRVIERTAKRRGTLEVA